MQAIPGPHGVLRASSEATGDRLLGPSPCSFFLVPQAQGLPFWFFLVTRPLPCPPTLATRGSSSINQLSSQSHLCIGVCDHHPSGTSRQEEVEVEGMRENRLAPLP